MVRQKKTWLLHFYYNKTMVNFLKSPIITKILISEVDIS